MTTSASQGQPAVAGSARWTGQGRVIAAVDGSPNSVAALRRAVSQARRRHAELDIVYVLPSGTDAGAAAAGQDLLACAVRQAFPDGLPVTARCRVERGEPGPALVRLSEGAELLVIGGHRDCEHGDVLGGEIVSRCLGYAHCPVNICADHSSTRRGEPSAHR